MTMKKNMSFSKILSILHDRTKDILTGSEIIRQEYGHDPFLMLIFCLLSLRTRDSVALNAARKLFSIAATPEAVAHLTPQHIEALIYPVGFYKRKAVQIRQCADKIIKNFDGNVPNNENDLLSLPGVGRKTMNLVLQDGFLLPAFCVDTHVHRIANKLGLVSTKTPEETEYALKALLPKSKWKTWNRALLLWGQYICKPWKHACNLDSEKH
jgi:endonuclease-3